MKACITLICNLIFTQIPLTTFHSHLVQLKRHFHLIELVTFLIYLDDLILMTIEGWERVRDTRHQPIFITPFCLVWKYFCLLKIKKKIHKSRSRSKNTRRNGEFLSINKRETLFSHSHGKTDRHNKLFVCVLQLFQDFPCIIIRIY